MVGPTFIRDYRQGVTALLTAFETLRALQLPYDKLDLGTTLTDEDFTQGHSDITKTQFVAAVGSVQAFEAAFQTLAAAGHLTNLYRLTP